MTSIAQRKALTLTQAVEVFDQAKPRGDAPRGHALHVKVFAPGSVGGTPSVAVTAMHIGIDWDAGKLLIDTDKPLTILSPEDVAAIHKSAKEGQSWHAYQYKKQDAIIKAQAAELEALKGDIARALADLTLEMEATRWIPVSERLPQESETLAGRVAALDTDGIMVIALLVGDGLMTSSSLPATHWMQTPSAK